MLWCLFDSIQRKLVEWNFKEADVNGKYTLIDGDIVKFKIATDKRTRVMRATDINLIESSLQKEAREYGCIQESSAEHHIIKCADREDSVYFHYNELLPFGCNQQQTLNHGDCVEFSVVTVIDTEFNRKPRGFNFTRKASSKRKFRILVILA
jgi:hypothetical protein